MMYERAEAVPSCRLLCGDAAETLATLPAESVQCVITSPPYWNLRDYGVPGQIGLEPDLGEYLDTLVRVFRAVRRVLRKNGVLWLNIGDSYAVAGRSGAQGKTGQRANRTFTAERLPPHVPTGLKPKDLCMVPARLALSLQADGWWLRSDCIWEKSNCLPEAVTDRPTKSHEYLFLLAKSARYYYDAGAIAEEAIKGSANAGSRNWRPLDAENQRVRAGQSAQSQEDGRNKRTVWTIPTEPNTLGGHFAVMPEALVQPCVLAGSRVGDIVLDPFCGTSTVGIVALSYGRTYIGIDLNPDYIALSRRRLGLFAQEEEATA